jgi:hypothetical protein
MGHLGEEQEKIDMITVCLLFGKMTIYIFWTLHEKIIGLSLNNQ